jgi:hypothetical protein
MSRYNFDDPWCWEFQVGFETFAEGLLPWPKTQKRFKILRDPERAEKPDLNWRMDNIGTKYQ